MQTVNTDGLTAPDIIISPSQEFQPESRIWQGVPSIEVSHSGRLWAAWYSGGRSEMPGNYIILSKSDDHGKSWQDPTLIVAPKEGIRTFDPCLWIDPKGKLWLFWAQSGEYKYLDGRAGVWAITSTDHNSGKAHWSDPFRVSHGIMIQKPIVTSNNEWLLPVSLWTVATIHGKSFKLKPEIESYAGAGVVASTDEGKSWEWRGSMKIECSSYDEHTLIEKNDGSIWMLIRTLYGIGQSESHDGGRTWSRGRATDLDGPDAKFFIRRLHSGNLLLINHVNFNLRSHLTALLSRDDGKTWEGGLLLDERSNVSYPDGCQDENGKIYIIYDRERGGMRDSLSQKQFQERKNFSREVLMAEFTEDEVLNQQCHQENLQLKKVISRLGPRPNFTIESFLKNGGLDWDSDKNRTVIRDF